MTRDTSIGWSVRGNSVWESSDQLNQGGTGDSAEPQELHGPGYLKPHPQTPKKQDGLSKSRFIPTAQNVKRAGVPKVG